MHWVADKTV